MIRHGESTGNVEKIISHDKDAFPLTEKGVKQAQIVGEELKGIEIEKIYSSPILRARQTAEIISKVVGCKVVVEEKIGERYFGRLNNRKVNSINWKVLFSNGRFGDLETFEEIYSRTSEFLKGRDDRIIVMVSHYDPIKALLSRELGFYNEFSSWGIVIPNASSSIIVNDGNGYRKVIGVGIPPFRNVLRPLLEPYIKN